MAEVNKQVLPRGLEIEIRSMSIDDIDDCRDSIKVTFSDGSPSGVGRVHSSRTKWLRKGLIRVDEWFSKNGEGPPDEILKRLDEGDREKAAALIQDAQVVLKKS